MQPVNLEHSPLQVIAYITPAITCMHCTPLSVTVCSLRSFQLQCTAYTTAIIHSEDAIPESTLLHYTAEGEKGMLFSVKGNICVISYHSVRGFIMISLQTADWHFPSFSLLVLQLVFEFPAFLLVLAVIGFSLFHI